MSIEKKHLISNLKATKKAIIAASLRTERDSANLVLNTERRYLQLDVSQFALLGDFGPPPLQTISQADPSPK